MSNKKVRILVVEDEAIVALDLTSRLKMIGYDVVGTAATGADAIAKAVKLSPDLMLMDIILKGDMDGIQASEAIRSKLGIPIIFLTACADDATLERAKITEPFGYLLKPFEERELHSHIEIALYKHKMEKKLRESEERYSLATKGANDGLWDWNLDSNEIYFSPRFGSMLGYAEGLFGNSSADWFTKIHPVDRAQVEKKLSEHIAGRSSHFESEYRIQDSSNNYRWVLCRGLALRHSRGRAYRIAGSQTDITERKVYNPLTGLPNQVLLTDRLERALKRGKIQGNNAFAVLALDVDGLRMIKDSLGYVVADQLLVQIAGRIQGCLSPQDTVSHFGKDDFVLLLEGVRDGSDALQMADRIYQELIKPFQVEEQVVYISPTIGVTLSTGDYTCPEDLLRDASTAMHRATSEGNGRCEIFQREMRSSAVARLKLEADLRKALEQRDFRVHYQPIVSLKSGQIEGFEALVRWQRSGELVYPGDFIAVAESTDMIIQLERWVLLEACSQVAKWQGIVDVPLTANVNLCAQHYASPDLIAALEDALGRSGLEPSQLRLEITESSLMANTEIVLKTLSQIQNLNVQVHIDDFGTGYSSLSYLNRFPINTLKIDRSFVGKLGMCKETWKIVKAIVGLARNLGMEVIAEGIENLMQLKMLQTLHCEFGQGYYFSKPLDPRAVEPWLSGHYPWNVAFMTTAPRVFPFSVEAKA
jgi:diguanylate cyclase (GGDEF)-like protein/PAS domain S-box-containing protein